MGALSVAPFFFSLIEDGNLFLEAELGAGASVGTPSGLGCRRGCASVRAIVAPAKADLRVSTKPTA
ncbi:hypothetical protein AZI87_05415 [Bdellovibrio bacteriovorus]|uniref:Uncharacterized protein n=1 Tax=Bdellovibrio bacteriovorus TaxID=959 RepID=A0A161PEB0_BDEBC|nr:hypothetical protein AZI87_05415 [Bdellovibrio bacteriovorus]